MFREFNNTGASHPKLGDAGMYPSETYFLLQQAIGEALRRSMDEEPVGTLPTEIAVALNRLMSAEMSRQLSDVEGASMSGVVATPENR
jgi:hypothetical protein